MPCPDGANSALCSKYLHEDQQPRGAIALNELITEQTRRQGNCYAHRPDIAFSEGKPFGNGDSATEAEAVLHK